MLETLKYILKWLLYMTITLVVAAIIITAGVILLSTQGCAVKRVYNGMYCTQRDTAGHCIVYAKQPYPCTHTPDGSCTESTK